MKKIYLVLFILTIFAVACSPETKVYKVNYKLNYPEGAFKVNVGNSTAFTNGNDILEVKVNKSPEFFCYSVNNQSLCSLELEIKISDKAAGSFKSSVENFQEMMQKSGKNKTTLPQRISYYLNDQKLEQEDVIKTNEKRTIVSLDSCRSFSDYPYLRNELSDKLRTAKPLGALICAETRIRT